MTRRTQEVQSALRIVHICPPCGHLLVQPLLKRISQRTCRTDCGKPQFRNWTQWNRIGHTQVGEYVEVKKIVNWRSSKGRDRHVVLVLERPVWRRHNKKVLNWIKTVHIRGGSVVLVLESPVWWLPHSWSFNTPGSRVTCLVAQFASQLEYASVFNKIILIYCYKRGYGGGGGFWSL